MGKYFDSGWLAVYIAIGLGALQLVQFLSRKGPALRYEVGSPSHIVSVKENAADDVEVFYQGNRVKDLSIVWVAFQNTGNTSISASQISVPIAIRFPNSEQIIYAHTD